MTTTPPVLEVRDLTVTFDSSPHASRPVDGISFDVGPGEIVGIVGESGSGKTLSMLALLNLVPAPGRIHATALHYHDRDLRHLDNRSLSRIRGRQMALIPPDAGAALNPVVRVGPQMEEGLRTHAPKLTSTQRRSRVLDSLRAVRLPRPELRVRGYPHELSGGMQQRVAIAMGVQLGPGLLIADEPTTALDVTVQAQILRLLLDVRDRYQTSILFVTHDVTTVAEICDRVLVMYAGQIVERGSVAEVGTTPRHPYTQALLDSVPPLGGNAPTELTTIPGLPPDPARWPPACRFAPRCWLRRQLGDPADCTTTAPALGPLTADHQAACHFRHQMTATVGQDRPGATVEDGR